MRSSPSPPSSASVDGEQRAADAIADGVDLALAGRLLDRVERLQDALAACSPRSPCRACRSSGLTQEMTNTVWPDAQRMKRFLRVEVEDVELVDPGRQISSGRFSTSRSSARTG